MPGLSCLQLMHPALIVEQAMQESASINSSESHTRQRVSPSVVPVGQVSHTPALVHVSQSLSHFAHWPVFSSKKKPYLQMQF